LNRSDKQLIEKIELKIIFHELKKKKLLLWSFLGMTKHLEIWMCMCALTVWEFVRFDGAKYLRTEIIHPLLFKTIASFQ